MDRNDVELLRQLATGTTHFRPVQDEPSDSPRWLEQVERLRSLRDQGLIRMPEPEKANDQPGYPTGVGPCELTTEGRSIVDNLAGQAPRGGPGYPGPESPPETGAGGTAGSG